MPGTFSRRRLIKRLCGTLAAGLAAPRLYGFSLQEQQPPQGEEAAGGGRAQMFRIGTRVYGAILRARAFRRGHAQWPVRL